MGSKKSNKKKNKQPKSTEDGGPTFVEPGQSTSLGPNHTRKASESVRNDAAVEADVVPDRHHSSDAESTIEVEADRQHWVHKEASLKETIRQLQNEIDTHMKNEASLEETIRQLQNEKDAHMQNESSLEETIRQLRNEKDAHIQNEPSLKETIRQLQSEKDKNVQNEARLEETIRQSQNEKDTDVQNEMALEMRIEQLQSGKDAWIKKEVNQEEKMSQLLEQKVFLSSKEAKLEEEIKCLEREKESWVLKENIAKETVAGLIDDNKRFQLQVMELQESHNNVIQENQQLSERARSLQSQDCSVIKDLSSQVDAAGVLIERLVTENAELVEKVNELLIDWGRQGKKAGLSSAVESDFLMAEATENSNVVHPISDSRTSGLGDTVVPLNAASVKDGRIVDTNMHNEQTAGSPRTLETGESKDISEIYDYGEIVQVPLDVSKNEDQEDLESQAAESDKNDASSLSDAPLTGAPFRLVSFVARYVSGADLVDRVPKSQGPSRRY